MPDWAVALVAGALGGAVVTGLVNVLVEAWRDRREDEWRFAHMKRERYAAFLRELDAYTHKVKHAASTS